MKTVIIFACVLLLPIFAAFANPKDDQFEKIAKAFTPGR
jgi:hypothetical protein